MAWFAVKTFLRTRTIGRPKNRDANYRSGLAAVEERIVLFRATNGDAAIRKGRAEADKYAKSGSTRNVYGQPVVTELLGYTEAFEMFEDPGDRVELFSSIEIVAAGETARSVIRRKIGEPAGHRTARLFIPAEISERLTDKLGEW